MVDRLSIRTIIDNTAGLPGIGAEHGSSILIETPESAVLLDCGRSALVRHNARRLGVDLRVFTEPVELAPGVWTSGEIPRDNGPEALNPQFRARRHGRTEVDHVLDDQFLWMRTPGGLVAVFGCCHAGLENSLHRLRDISGDDRIRLIVGGLHLLNRTPAEAREIAARIAGINPGAIVVGHCAGFEASVALAAALPGRVFRNGVGTRIDVGADVKVR